MGKFPSMKAADLLRVIERDLGYEVTRQSGSHRTMDADGRPTLRFAFHAKQSLPGSVVRKVLVKDVGLSEAEALGLL